MPLTLTRLVWLDIFFYLLIEKCHHQSNNNSINLKFHKTGSLQFQIHFNLDWHLILWPESLTCPKRFKSEFENTRNTNWMTWWIIMTKKGQSLIPNNTPMRGLLRSSSTKYKKCKIRLFWKNIGKYSFGRRMQILAPRGKGKDHFCILLFMIKQGQETHFQNKHSSFPILAP